MSALCALKMQPMNESMIAEQQPSLNMGATALDFPSWMTERLARTEEALSRWVGICAPAGLGEAMYDDETLAGLFIEKIKSMNLHMGIPTTIYALKEKDIPELAKRILKEGNPTYPVPRIMNYQECCDILRLLCPERTPEA